MTDTTQSSLLLRVKDRDDSAAWREFVALYRPMLIRFARARGLNADDAEEIAQECLASVAQHIRSFAYDRARGGFKKWLRTMVNNRVRNELAKRGRRRVRQAASGDFRRPQQREPRPSQVFEEIWLEGHVKHCLKQIRARVDPRTYASFKRSLDGWSAEKVAEAVGITRQQVHMIKSRYTRQLREMMKALLMETA